MLKGVPQIKGKATPLQTVGALRESRKTDVLEALSDEDLAHSAMYQETKKRIGRSICSPAITTLV